jgi:hypothetical protein
MRADSIKIVYHPLAVGLGALRPETDFVLVFEASPIGPAGLGLKII